MKKETSDALDAALRSEPAYRELCELLEKQSDARKARLAYELATSQYGDDSQPRGAETMESTAREIDTRIVELKDREGLSFTKVAERLTSEGYRNQAGGKFTRATVSKRYYRVKDKAPPRDPQPCEEATEPVGLSDLSEPCETCENEAPEKAAHRSGEVCEPGEPSQHPIPPEWIDGLRTLIRQEISAMIPQVASTAKPAMLPPPTPKVKGTKKLLGERVTLPGTRIDKALADAFETERRNLAISASELMQRVLWGHFGKPRLSFQSPESSGKSER